MMDVKSQKHIKDLVDKTIANHKTMIESVKVLDKPPQFQTDLDKQRAYSGASMNRCRRCGDAVFHLVAATGMTSICNPCELLLRGWEEPMWFVELLDKSSGKK